MNLGTALLPDSEGADQDVAVAGRVLAVAGGFQVHVRRPAGTLVRRRLALLRRVPVMSAPGRPGSRVRARTQAPGRQALLIAILLRASLGDHRTRVSIARVHPGPAHAASDPAALTGTGRPQIDAGAPRTRTDRRTRAADRRRAAPMVRAARRLSDEPQTTPGPGSGAPKRDP